MNRLPRHPSSPKVCENAPKNNRNTNRSKNTHFFSERSGCGFALRNPAAWADRCTAAVLPQQ